MLEDLFSVVKVRFNGDKADDDKKKTDIPKGLLFKCPRCRNVTFMEEFQANGKVCPHCNYHSRLTAKERLDITIDKGRFEEFDKDMVSKNPIDFTDYEEKQQENIPAFGQQKKRVSFLLQIGEETNHLRLRCS